MTNKREKGQYYTVGNPFSLKPFRSWAKSCDLGRNWVLEPFAGAGDIRRLCDDVNIKPKRWKMFDIEPQNVDVDKRDTLSDFPMSYYVCITNPPWLAKNSATRRNLEWPDECEYDDLYKYALEQCLHWCPWVAAIIPESYIRSELFFDRLSDFVSLVSDTGKMFDDTEHPVGLALFTPDMSDDIRIWRDNEQLGTYQRLKQYLPPDSNNQNIKFNDPDGNLGLIAVDNTEKASIRFCTASEIPDDYVTPKCRSKTRISMDGEPNVYAYNCVLNKIRKDTHDVFMTAFKGIRKDGLYRRRLDWKLARSIIDSVASAQATIKLL